MNDDLVSAGWSKRCGLAFAYTVMVDVALLSGGAFAAAMVATQGGVRVPGLPDNPLLILVVAWVMAHCSVVAVWWGRTSLSPHSKTLLAALFCGGLWLLLVGVLESVSLNEAGSAEWAASLIVQMLLLAAIVILCELTIDYQVTAARNRFSILFLLVWTTVIAVLLAAGGKLAARGGWTIADVGESEFFAQIQLAGLLNTLLAMAVYLSLRLSKSWTVRAVACTATVIATGIIAPAIMIAVFKKELGVFVADLVWLFVGEGFFLLATLIPAEFASSYSMTRSAIST